MIRDPSDGTVKSVVGIPATEDASKLSAPMPVSEPDITSALAPLPKDAKERARLKDSREWLAQYRKAVDDANRMNDKGEIPNPVKEEGELKDGSI